ncbi:MAG TPA: filamentous hemagglutinin [Cyanobacteria bacterium UBA11049]|nr:filamentous hemagglutinin [Cyanobacteria bacterium UBA11049]
MKTILVRSIISGAIIAISGNFALAQSQIVPDNTLGAESSSVTPAASDSTVDEIQGGAIRGANLFHSFREFNVGEGRSAYFLSPNANIQNILARVTGGNPSEILGTLGTRSVSSPNLFLINPNGIIFGQNARLDVGGSFVASTASSLKFADENQFSTTEPQTTPLLTVSVPIGLQFGEGMGKIVNQSVAVDSDNNLVGLQVQPGKTLALVGSDVVLEGGYLTAESGQIELSSVANSSLVSLTPNAQDWALGYEGVQNFGNIQLLQESYVDVGGNGSGNIQVQGKRVTLTDGSKIQALNGGDISGGTVAVNASDSLELNRSSSIQTDAIQKTTTAAGDLEINTRNLIVQDGAFISTSTSGLGKGGEMRVNASDSVTLSGVNRLGLSSGLFASTRGDGQGGNITVNTSAFRVADGAVVGARTRFTGNAGNITVNANTLETVRGGQILTATLGNGRAGNINLNVSNTISLSGSDPTYPDRLARLGRNNINNEGAASGLFANTTERSTGNGGDVTLKTGQLNVSDRAEVAVSSGGSGNAGNLQIQAGSIRLEDRGKLTAAIGEIGQGGGNITLQDLDLLLLRGNSEISTNAQGAGNGGNINIDTDLLAATENSNITANAVEGRGGNIRIAIQGLFLSPDSIIDASSETGINGIVEINRPDIDPTAELVTLPAQIVDVSRLVASGCGAGGGNIAAGTSEFVNAGRGGLPPTPAEATRSDTTLADLGKSDRIEGNRASVDIPNNSIATDPNDSISTESAPLVEASGWVTNSKGEVILTANAPNFTTDVPWLTPTSCKGS